MSNNTPTISLYQFLKRVIRYALHYKRWVYIFIGFIAFVGLLEALFPLVSKSLLDTIVAPQVLAQAEARAAGKSYTWNLAGVWAHAIAFGTIIIIYALSIAIFIHYTGKVQEYVLADLRRDMFIKLQYLPFSYFDKSSTGWLLSRFTTDVDRVATLISWGLIEGVWGISNMIACLIILMYFKWQLGLVVLLSIPLMLLVSVRLRLSVLKYSRETRRINADLTAQFTEHLNGVILNKATGQEERATQNFSGTTRLMRRASFKAGFYTALYLPVVAGAGALAVLIVFLWGGKMALDNMISIGTLWMAFNYAAQIFFPIMDLTTFYAEAQSSLSAGERIFNLLDEPITLTDAPDATDFARVKGDIKFKDISFYYEKENPVLHNFNLRIPAGQSVALVGATGEGKTTITSLIARFYEPQEGTISIDGEAINTKTLRSLRQNIAMVLQNPHLFNGSIRDNLRYGRPEATDEELRQALKAAGAERFAEHLDDIVGEGGSRLSLGERQLVSFARAMLTDASILIMDEATSSIDTPTEAHIQAGIRQLLAGRTALIIAHRLSTIEHCDRILVIQKGGIIEDGTHAELLALKGKYYDLHSRQFQD